MLYGEEKILYDASAEGASAIALDQAAAGVIYQKFQILPRTLEGFGVKVVTNFNYHTPTQLAVLTLFKYPGGATSSLAYSGGAGAQPVPGATVTGATSGATATLVRVTGTWGNSGVLYLINKSGAFIAGETLNIPSGSVTCINAQGGDAVTIKVALGTITLTDGVVENYVFYCDALNRAQDIQPAVPAPALGIVGDVFAIELTTPGTGGSYPSGTYQPYMVVSNRGETRSTGVQPLFIDQSPVVI
jgi:hypothetical protein